MKWKMMIVRAIARVDETVMGAVRWLKMRAEEHAGVRAALGRPAVAYRQVLLPGMTNCRREQ